MPWSEERRSLWTIVLVAFVALLGGFLSPLPVRSQVPRLEVKTAPTELPDDDPWAPVWDSAAARQVVLSAQEIVPPFGGGGVEAVTVRALQHEGRIFILLEWSDDDLDDMVSGSTRFADAAAVQFPIDPGDEPPYTMGSASLPVNIWQWKAAWQADLERGFQTGDALYPNTAVDLYPDADDPIYRPAFDVGNQLADPDHGSPVENLVARGFGTLSPADVQDVSGSGAWRTGVWRALFARSLDSSESTARFSAERETLVAFAIWDGGEGDRNGQKSIAPFIALALSDEVASAPPSGAGGERNLIILWLIGGVLGLLLIVSVVGMINERLREP